MHVCVSDLLVTLWEGPGTYILFFFIILPQSCATRCAEWFMCARSPPRGHGRGRDPQGRRSGGKASSALPHTVAEQRDGGRRPSGSRDSALCHLGQLCLSSLPKCPFSHPPQVLVLLLPAPPPPRASSPLLCQADHVDGLGD